ncbi:MAG: DUF354 domain-containing protein [Pseudomonadota bacterium]
MRVLFDIVHPAHAQFFLNPIRILQQRGAEVLILSRHKDIVCELLNEFGLPHRPVSRAGAGLGPLATELLLRDMRVFHECRRFRPDVMVGYGGVAISHVGRLLGVPSVSFYDHETATLQIRLTWPFINHLYVPESYNAPVPAGKTMRFPGTKHLSYLHPDTFKPSRETALAAGLDPAHENFLVRVVSWNANHDVGKSGLSDEQLHRLVNRLSRRGHVIISSERELPEDLRPMQYQGRLADMHHLMAHCDLVIGDSPTMAAESAILGVPGVCAGLDRLGYVTELQNAGLLHWVDASQPGAVDAVIYGFELYMGREAHRKRLDQYLSDKRDLSGFVVSAIEKHARG